MENVVIIKKDKVKRDSIRLVIDNEFDIGALEELVSLLNQVIQSMREIK